LSYLKRLTVQRNSAITCPVDLSCRTLCLPAGWNQAPKSQPFRIISRHNLFKLQTIYPTILTAPSRIRNQNFEPDSRRGSLCPFVKMPGFDFSNHTRNAALHARGVPLPKATSTGTTIVGCIFDGGVVVRMGRTSPLSLHVYSKAVLGHAFTA
jgi:hypothetical protein